jgi:hypothetical protein
MVVKKQFLGKGKSLSLLDSSSYNSRKERHSSRVNEEQAGPRSFFGYNM